MKKVICVIAVVCMMMSILSNYAYADFAKASNWAVPELNTADEYGLISDSIKNDMSKPITRLEFAEVCIRVYELTTNSIAKLAPANTFSDTQNPDVLKAFHLGVVTGIGDGKFGPNITTNREQIATMLKRLIFALTPNMNSFDLETAYGDSEQISNWAIESVDLASKYKFITGWNNNFDAKGLCTREMAVIIAKRVYEFYNGDEQLDEDALQKSEVLGIAKDYYQKTVSKVEEKGEFLRVINFTPDFTGQTTDIEKARLLSADAAQLITYTGA